jgi:hypothetical protein
MILAIGEVGGAKAWLRFFENYEGVLDRLRVMGALPTAEITDLTPNASGNQDGSVPRNKPKAPAGSRREAR